MCRVQSLAECEGLQGAEPACACQAHVCARAGSVVCVPRSGFTRRAAPLSKAMAACIHGEDRGSLQELEARDEGFRARTMRAEFRGVRAWAPVASRKWRRRVLTLEASSRYARVDGARWLCSSWRQRALQVGWGVGAGPSRCV